MGCDQSVSCIRSLADTAPEQKRIQSDKAVFAPPGKSPRTLEKLRPFLTLTGR
jgi:hypothetical protein